MGIVHIQQLRFLSEQHELLRLHVLLSMIFYYGLLQRNTLTDIPFPFPPLRPLRLTTITALRILRLDLPRQIVPYSRALAIFQKYSNLLPWTTVPTTTLTQSGLLHRTTLHLKCFFHKGFRISITTSQMNPRNAGSRPTSISSTCSPTSRAFSST